tara:strand:- start:426 stop:992 length:567 start_codon:yes stop_codon:yes gene_type:complete
MGKKISVDSATMMNKVFEIIEAIKIFELNKNKFEIIIHPKSFVHAIVHFKTGITKILAHETSMEIPIFNSLHQNHESFIYNTKKFKFSNLNGINFIEPDNKKFPFLNLLKNFNNKNSYFETILIALNDGLVKKYLNDEISFISLQKNLIKLIKHQYFRKYYYLSPNNINDIKNMVKKVNTFLNKIRLN